MSVYILEICTNRRRSSDCCLLICTYTYCLSAFICFWNKLVFYLLLSLSHTHYPFYHLHYRFPHTTFTWEGIDGSTLLAHFPPADTYNAQCSVEEILKSESNHKSKMTSRRSLLLFGHGDGGGGPAVSHLERLIRLKALTNPQYPATATRQEAALLSSTQTDSDAPRSYSDSRGSTVGLMSQVHGVLPVVRTDQTPSEFFESIEQIDYQKPSSLTQLFSHPLQQQEHGMYMPITPAQSSQLTHSHSHDENPRHRMPLPRWVGELYLELHQGTLTSQAKTKQLNRFCEGALRAVEALTVFYTHKMRGMNSGDSSSSQRWHSLDICVRKCWELLLLNQFHDVLRKRRN
jgi:alpha-mannosidase